MSASTIDHQTLSKLVDAGAVRGVHIIGQGGGWAVLVKYGMKEHPLVAQRSGDVRLFSRFETLVAYLRGIGIARFEVDAANYDPTRTPRKARPDRSEALKRAHAAAGRIKAFDPALHGGEFPNQASDSNQAGRHL